MKPVTIRAELRQRPNFVNLSNRLVQLPDTPSEFASREAYSIYPICLSACVKLCSPLSKAMNPKGPVCTLPVLLFCSVTEAEAIKSFETTSIAATA